eukprot:maker-scaffold_62-snap-gene-0.5-mRNA-1 protein AED:0.34 eAED:0.34 QI:0/0.33/0.25/1/0/0/4/325/129
MYPNEAKLIRGRLNLIVFVLCLSFLKKKNTSKTLIRKTGIVDPTIIIIVEVFSSFGIKITGERVGFGFCVGEFVGDSVGKLVGTSKFIAVHSSPSRTSVSVRVKTPLSSSVTQQKRRFPGSLGPNFPRK